MQADQTVISLRPEAAAAVLCVVPDSSPLASTLLLLLSLPILRLCAPMAVSLPHSRSRPILAGSGSPPTE
uniref:Uncharacterized protein n=1 Tax=Fagus sylvatica TaxID=28930 RepID=A0A2N9FLA8_FAGSY